MAPSPLAGVILDENSYICPLLESIKFSLVTQRLNKWSEQRFHNEYVMINCRITEIKDGKELLDHCSPMAVAELFAVVSLPAPCSG